MRVPSSQLIVVSLLVVGCTSQPALEETQGTSGASQGDDPGAVAQEVTTSGPSTTTLESIPTTSTSAPTTTTTLPPPVEPSALIGTWKIADVNVFLVFNDDGTWSGGYTRAGDGFDWGTYTFDGRVLTIRSSEDIVVSTCSPAPGSYETAFSADGESIAFTSIDDPCRERGTDLRGGLRRVESAEG